jgi:hypothetical protein
MSVLFRSLVPVILLALAAGCSAPQVERQHRESPPYTISVLSRGPATVTSDGFSARLAFEVVSQLDLQRNSLVQELTQEVVLEYRNGSTSRRSFNLVEAFRLRPGFKDAMGMNHYRLEPGQNDHHSLKGLDKLGRDVVGVTVNRRVFAYVANVYGADFTDFGFAHLPQNQDGSVVTEAPPTFNETYQTEHATRGRIVDAADSLGLVYRISYHLSREGGSPKFVLDRDTGAGDVQRPAVIVR